MNYLTEKSCCCIPLRKGLLCMSYARLIICTATITFYVIVCVDIFNKIEESFNDPIFLFQSVACIIPQVLDFVFTLMFVVASHKKSLKTSEVFYFYCITMILVYLLIMTLSIWTWNERSNMLTYTMFPAVWFMNFTFYEFIIFAIVVILLQLYMTMLVRSQVIKLKKRCKAKIARQRSTTSFRLPKLNIKT